MSNTKNTSLVGEVRIVSKKGVCSTTPMTKFGTHNCLGEGVSLKNEQTYQSTDIWLGILKIGTGSQYLCQTLNCAK